MSSIASIMSLVAALSLNDKLQLNAQLAAQMAGAEGLGASVTLASASKKPSARKGKPAAPGTKAWSAFIEHCRATMPERFASAPPKDRMIIAKAIKDEDPEAYKAFAAKYIAEHPASETASVASASDAEQPVSELIPFRDWGSASANAAWLAEKKAKNAKNAEKAEKPKRVMSDEQKAKMKAGREAAKAVKDAAKASGETPPPKAKAAKAPGAPKKAVATASVGGASAPAPQAAAIPQPVFEEDAGQTKVTVGGDEYFLQTATNDLYAVEGDGMGAFVGRYDPATGDIDFDAEPSDE
jgi:hypothetical protein